MTDQMHDPEIEKVVAAAQRASLPWSPARQQRVSWAMMSRIEGARRRRPLIALSFAGAVAAAVCLFVYQRRPPAPPTAAPAWQLASSLADGTRVVRDDAATVLRKTVEAPDDVLFELDAGGARFEVARRPSRVFRVHAGDVTVQVIGTGFRVRRAGTRCQVAVEHGRVLVSWWGGSHELGAGEQGTFPPETAAGTLALDTEPASPLSASASSAGHLVKHAPPPSVAGPEALFARADHARADGNPELALATLRDLRARFPRDPRDGAAAFTMGRLLLESLHRPREAAVAFADARRLARGDSTLAEDALAREVEALHTAGNGSAARARAELYRSLFPRGLRLQIVERFGGIKADP